MNKRILSLALCVGIGVAVLGTACTKEKVLKDTETKVINGAEEVNEETKETVSDENNGESYEILSETYTEINEKVETNIKYPVLVNMKDKKIEDSFNNVIKERVDEYKNLYNRNDTDDKETLKQTIFVDYEILRKEKDYISLKLIISLYTEGAAHPNNFLDSITFDLETGSELRLKDLFKEDSDYEKTLNEVLNEKVKELEYELFEEYKGLEEHQQFYLTDNGLAIYYQPYVYTPHAVGPLILEVPFAEIKDILK